MAHGWNPWCKTALALDAGNEGVPSSPEDNLQHHIERHVGQELLSDTAVPQDCSNLNSDNLSDPLHQKNLGLNDEGEKPLCASQHSDLLDDKSRNITGLPSPDLACSNHSAVGAHDNSHEERLNSAILGQYSDVSSCSEPDVNTVTPSTELSPVSNRQNETQEMESSWELGRLEVPLPFHVAGCGGVNESIDPTCGSTSGMSFLPEVPPLVVLDGLGYLTKHLDKKVDDNRRESRGSAMTQEELSSNVSRLPDSGCEKSPLKEDVESQKKHATTCSQEMNALECHVAANNPSKYYSSFEVTAAEDDYNTPAVLDNYSYMLSEESAPNNCKMEPCSRPFSSCKEVTQNLYSEMRLKGKCQTESLHKEKNESFGISNGEEEHCSSFEFLERCFALSSFSTDEKKTIREKGSQKSTAAAISGVNAVCDVHEILIPKAGPLEKVQETTSVVDGDKEPAMLNVCPTPPKLLDSNKITAVALRRVVKDSLGDQGSKNISYSNFEKVKVPVSAALGHVPPESCKEASLGSLDKLISHSNMKTSHSMFAQSKDNLRSIPSSQKLPGSSLSVHTVKAKMLMKDKSSLTVDEMIDGARIAGKGVAHLMASQQLKRLLHPVVLLKATCQYTAKTKGYHCVACNDTTPIFSHLIEHHHSVHSSYKFHFCQACSSYFTDGDLAKQHLCSQVTNCALQLGNFGQPQEKKGKWRTLRKCQYCSLTFTKLYEIHKHERTHTGTTPFKCSKCGLYFAQSASLNRHRRLDRCTFPHLQKAARIQMSQKVNSAGLEKQTLKTQEFPCSSPYDTIGNCYVKLVDFRKKNPTSEHSCEVCGKSFHLRAHLIAHSNTHGDQRPFKCHICMKAFRHASNLYRHKKKCFSSKINDQTKLASQLKYVVGGYKCPLCPRIFKYSYNRFRHMRQQCLKDFSRQGKGKKGNMYKCALCSRTFTNPSNRNRHIKTSCLKEYIRKEHLKIKRVSQEQKQGLPQKPQPLPLITQPQQNAGFRHKCNLCPATFAHPSGKYKHVRKHKLYEKTGQKFRYRTSAPVSEKPESFSQQSHCGKSNSDDGLPYSCSFCGKQYNTSVSLKKHMRLHSGERPYRCLECGKCFLQRSHLVTHKNVHQRRIQCTVCKKIVPTISELIKHRKSHIKRGMLQCPDCPLQFKYPAFLLRHLPAHSRVEQRSSLQRPLQQKQRSPQKHEHQQQDGCEFRCSLCKEVFDSTEDLNTHCFTHLPKRSTNQCPFCKRNFSSRGGLIRHIRLHTGEKPYRCQDCGRSFSRSEALKTHREKCPVSQEEPVGVNKNEQVTMAQEIDKPYKCKYCPQSFVWPCSLSKHHKNHTLKMLIPCSKCGKCFKKRRLLSHEKVCDHPAQIHTETPPSHLFACGNCKRAFCQKESQIFHEKTCNTASSVLSTNIGNINAKTIATRSIDKLKHRCPHCSKYFRYRSYLLRHLVVHTQDKPYTCMHCGRRYASHRRYLQHEAFCNGIYSSKQSKDEVKNKPVSMTTKQKGVHMSKGEIEGEYKCKFCTKSFMRSRNLRRHILTHTEVKPYRCKTCESCFSRYDHLKLHQNRCKGKRRLEVRIVKINLEDLGNGWKKKLEKPKNKEDKMFECSSCSKCFTTHVNLARHVALQHTTVKPFCCSHCNSAFSHHSSLKKHNLRCKGRMLISLSKAGSLHRECKTSRAPMDYGGNPPCRETSKLLIRIQRHYSDKRKFNCTYCPRRFKNQDQLTVHTRLHTGEKPFGCDNCGERFIRRDYLKRHLIKCNFGAENGNLLCDKCGKLFSSQDRLRSHQKCCVVNQKSSDHHPKNTASPSTSRRSKGFSCANCSQRFLLFSQLQQHFLNIHRKDNRQQSMIISDPLQLSPPPLQHQFSSIVDIKDEPVDDGYEENPLRNCNLITKNSMGTGNDKKPFMCSHCNLHFHNKSGLGMHLRIHSGKFPFFCPKCKRGFWSKNMQQKHRRKCCSLQMMAKSEPNPEVDIPLINSTTKNTVLVFNSGSKATGTGVLQTKFSCKEGNKDRHCQKQDSIDNQQTYTFPTTISNKYQCSECDQSFTDGLLLISHLEDHGRQEQARKQSHCCKYCGKVFSQPAVLYRHLKMQHRMKMPYACPECPKNFRYPSDLDVHRGCHDPSRPFICTLCNLRFWTNQSLNRHKSAIHTNHSHKSEIPSIYSCVICNQSYSNKRSYQKHCRLKHRKVLNEMGLDSLIKGNPYMQPEYDIEVNIEGESHSDSEEDDDDSDSAPYFPCHVCGKTFTTSESLEDHQRCHLGEKPHECEECGKCFFQLAHLQQHLRSHKSEFQCQTCGRGFVSLFALRKHKHTHGKSRPHRCPKCQLYFAGPTQLAEHMSTHRDENFPCDLCDRTFSCKLSRAQHRKGHTEPDDGLPPLLPPPKIVNLPSTSSSSPTSNVSQLKYRCGICCKRFRDPEQLSEHGCYAARERPYSCPECNQHFLHGSHLKKHQLCHQLSRSFTYQCNRCHICFAYRHHFLNHLKRHGIEEDADGLRRNDLAKASDNNPENIYQCPICPDSFCHAMELANHLSIHAENSYVCEKTTSESNLIEHEKCHLTPSMHYECTECGNSFLGNDAFRRHHCASRKHMEEEEEEEEVDVGEDFYNCHVCDKRFSSEHVLQDHQREHVKDSTFKCLVCGKLFAQRRYLKKHELIHQRPYRCNLCPQTFNHEKTYLTHQGLHNQKRQHQCPVCHKYFVTTQVLSRHMKTHGEQDECRGDFRCDMCYKSFDELSHLRQHQETHVGQVVYECTECDKAFAFFHLLEQHQSIHAGATNLPHSSVSPTKSYPSISPSGD